MSERRCVFCRYFIADREICAAPPLVDLAKLVHDKPVPGATIPAFYAKLNQALCGSPGYWFAENPPAPPETTEMQASA